MGGLCFSIDINRLTIPTDTEEIAIVLSMLPKELASQQKSCQSRLVSWQSWQFSWQTELLSWQVVKKLTKLHPELPKQLTK